LASAGGGNINQFVIDNLFLKIKGDGPRLTYADLTSISEDQHFGSQKYQEVLSEKALNVCESWGFPRASILSALKRQDLSSHAYASYYLAYLLTTKPIIKK